MLLEANMSEEYTNELLDGLVGREVIVTRLVGPALDQEFADAVKEDPMIYSERVLQAQVGLLEMVSYDNLGIVLRTISDDPIETFVPWGAVIQIYSRPRPEEMEG